MINLPNPFMEINKPEQIIRLANTLPNPYRDFEDKLVKVKVKKPIKKKGK